MHISNDSRHVSYPLILVSRAPDTRAYLNRYLIFQVTHRNGPTFIRLDPASVSDVFTVCADVNVLT